MLDAVEDWQLSSRDSLTDLLFAEGQSRETFSVATANVYADRENGVGNLLGDKPEGTEWGVGDSLRKKQQVSTDADGSIGRNLASGSQALPQNGWIFDEEPTTPSTTQDGLPQLPNNYSFPLSSPADAMGDETEMVIILVPPRPFVGGPVFRTTTGMVYGPGNYPPIIKQSLHTLALPPFDRLQYDADPTMFMLSHFYEPPPWPLPPQASWFNEKGEGALFAPIKELAGNGGPDSEVWQIPFMMIAGPVALLDGTVAHSVSQSASQARAQISKDIRTTQDPVQYAMGHAMYWMTYGGEGFAIYGQGVAIEGHVMALGPLLASGSRAMAIAPRGAKQVQLYSYFEGARDISRPFTTSSGRVYLSSHEPGQWLTETGVIARLRRFARTGRVEPYSSTDNYFTTGPINPAEWGFKPIFPKSANFWKRLGGQYHTPIGTSGFELASPGSNLLINQRIFSTGRQLRQARIGLAYESVSDIVVITGAGTGVFLAYDYFTRHEVIGGR